jgi:hypothetical protein
MLCTACLNSDFVGSANTINIIMFNFIDNYSFISVSVCVCRALVDCFAPWAYNAVKTALEGGGICVFIITFSNFYTPVSRRSVLCDWVWRAGVHTGFRTIALILFIGSLPNLVTWFPCGRGRTLFILGSLGQRTRSLLL